MSIKEIIRINNEEFVLRLYMDGNQWCCVDDNRFIDLHESNAGFGRTRDEAIEDFVKGI